MPELLELPEKTSGSRRASIVSDEFDDYDDPADIYEVLENLGEGTYGSVYRAKHKLSGELVAIKVMENTAELSEEIDTEYNILKDHCDHPNIPEFYGGYLKKGKNNEKQIWFVMELCDAGSASDVCKGLIENGKRLDEDIIAYIIKEMMSAIQYLHKNHVIHRDIKGQNLLLNSKAEVKLVDYGVSATLDSTMVRRSTSVGTPFWMAPEVIACEQQHDYDYDIRCDVWGIGITTIELAEGDPPLAELHPMKALFYIPRNPPPTLSQPTNWSADMNDFIGKCLLKDFERRPMVAELIRHPFISQVPDNPSEIKQRLMKQVNDHMTTGFLRQSNILTSRYIPKESTIVKNAKHLAMIDDLSTMETLDETTVVVNLERRFEVRQIYTNIADILIALNPFTNLDIYDEAASAKYRSITWKSLPPHVFASASEAYRSMMNYQTNQSLVISGESGSGKTETANFLVLQLTRLGKAKNRLLQEKILQVNPVLEAFGNASTVINSNSSRYGKYLELFFTEDGNVVGANISEYLLEKSRVTRLSSGEKNFHIFHYVHSNIIDGSDNGHLVDFEYLKEADDPGKDNKSVYDANAAKLELINHNLGVIGFTNADVEMIHLIITAILHLGQIKFVTDLSEKVKHQDGCVVENMEAVNLVSSMLEVDAAELAFALTNRSILSGGETMQKVNNPLEAADVRDAMAKALYGRLFNWIVCEINTLIQIPFDATCDHLVVGILDIFGFENFQNNSFEQLCINITNEQLQNYFNQYIFSAELQAYENEGIDAKDVVFTDNGPLLDLFFAKPVGFFALLDEESRFPKGSDSSMLHKMKNNLSDDYFQSVKTVDNLFAVKHYAGNVHYNVDGFLFKNRDTLAPDVIILLRASGIGFLQNMFQLKIAKTGNVSSPYKRSNAVKSSTDNFSVTVDSKERNSNKQTTLDAYSQTRNQQTLSNYFCFSLMELMEKMKRCTPNFIRCIKPNKNRESFVFDGNTVLEQLRCTGVLETSRIRKEGYSGRVTFEHFLKRYKIFVFKLSDEIEVSSENCKVILKRCNLKNWKIGKTKVFLKSGHLDTMDRILDKWNRKATDCQKVIRGFLCRKFLEMNKKVVYDEATVIMIQKRIRGWLSRMWIARLYKIENQAARKIQSAWRGYMVRNRICHQHSYGRLKKMNATITLQTYFRAWHDKVLYEHLRMMKSQQETQFCLFSQQVEKFSSKYLACMEASNTPVGKEQISRQIPSQGLAMNARVTTKRKARIIRRHLQKIPWKDEEIFYYGELDEGERRHRCLRNKLGRIKLLAEEKSYYNNVRDTKGDPHWTCHFNGYGYHFRNMYEEEKDVVYNDLDTMIMMNGSLGVVNVMQYRRPRRKSSVGVAISQVIGGWVAGGMPLNNRDKRKNKEKQSENAIEEEHSGLRGGFEERLDDETSRDRLIDDDYSQEQLDVLKKLENVEESHILNRLEDTQVTSDNANRPSSDYSASDGSVGEESSSVFNLQQRQERTNRKALPRNQIVMSKNVRPPSGTGEGSSVDAMISPPLNNLTDTKGFDGSKQLRNESGSIGSDGISDAENRGSSSMYASELNKYASESNAKIKGREYTNNILERGPKPNTSSVKRKDKPKAKLQTESVNNDSGSYQNRDDCDDSKESMLKTGGISINNEVSIDSRLLIEGEQSAKIEMSDSKQLAKSVATADMVEHSQSSNFSGGNKLETKARVAEKSSTNVGYKQNGVQSADVRSRIRGATEQKPVVPLAKFIKHAEHHTKVDQAQREIKGKNVLSQVSGNRQAKKFVVDASAKDRLPTEKFDNDEHMVTSKGKFERPKLKRTVDKDIRDVTNEKAANVKQLQEKFTGEARMKGESNKPIVDFRAKLKKVTPPP